MESAVGLFLAHESPKQNSYHSCLTIPAFQFRRLIFWVGGTLPVIYLVQPATELTDSMDVCVCTGTG